MCVLICVFLHVCICVGEVWRVGNMEKAKEIKTRGL